MLLPETLALHQTQQIEFHYIYFLPWKNQMVAAIEANGGKVMCMPASNNLQLIAKASAIAAYIKQHQIQVVHCHLPWAGIVGRIAGRMAKVPVIYTEHNKWERYHKATYWLNKITFPWQQLVVAVSNDVAESIQKHYKAKQPKISTILNGVNTEKFTRKGTIPANLHIPAGALVIGTVSVFRIQKRLDVWLSVAAALRQIHPHVYFIIVGDGPLREMIHAKAQALGLNDVIHFAGLQEEVRPYFAWMDVFMMASEFEGLPIALLEAMSMGCIPVCTNAGGIGEVVRHQQEGLIVPVQEPMLLVQALDQLIQQWDTTACQFANAARARVEDRFSLTAMVKSLEEVYQAVGKSA
ncbi:MAG TPA: glycosyl transferase family 1 [Chitinophagaceae bacterium]|nr:glycosyl transferase family 1 [Chitinophagaceae bacterium]